MSYEYQNSNLGSYGGLGNYHQMGELGLGPLAQMMSTGFLRNIRAAAAQRRPAPTGVTVRPHPPKPRPKAQPKAQPKPRPKAQPKPRPKAQPKPRPKAQPKPRPKVSPKRPSVVEVSPTTKLPPEVAMKPEAIPHFVTPPEQLPPPLPGIPLPPMAIDPTTGQPTPPAAPDAADAKAEADAPLEPAKTAAIPPGVPLPPGVMLAPGMMPMYGRPGMPGPGRLPAAPARPFITPQQARLGTLAAALGAGLLFF